MDMIHENEGVSSKQITESNKSVHEITDQISETNSVALNDNGSDSDETYHESHDESDRAKVSMVSRKKRRYNSDDVMSDDDSDSDDEDDEDDSDDEDDEDDSDDDDDDGMDEEKSSKSPSMYPQKVSKRSKIYRNHAPWKVTEDAIIIQKQKELGNCWAVIAQMLEGRTRIEVKRRFKSIAKAKKKLWTPQDDEVLLGLHKIHGSNWKVIASKMKNRTKNAVMLRYREIKYIQSNRQPLEPPPIGSAKQIFFTNLDETLTLEKITIMKQTNGKEEKAPLSPTAEVKITEPLSTPKCGNTASPSSTSPTAKQTPKVMETKVIKTETASQKDSIPTPPVLLMNQPKQSVVQIPSRQFSVQSHQGFVPMNMAMRFPARFACPAPFIQQPTMPFMSPALARPFIGMQPIPSMLNPTMHNNNIMQAIQRNHIMSINNGGRISFS